MGLDVTAYEKLGERIEVADGDDEPDLPYDQFTRVYINPDFPGRAPELETGWYLTSGKRIRLCAGGYMAYNYWRSELARMIGTTDRAIFRDPKPLPFVEMINFSDCEGTIGSGVSAKLAADFATWQDRAERHVPANGATAWFLGKYNEWRAAYELAANGGCVRFH